MCIIGLHVSSRHFRKFQDFSMYVDLTSQSLQKMWQVTLRSALILVLNTRKYFIWISSNLKTRFLINQYKY